MKFYPGQKVVCINANKNSRDEDLIQGEIYIVEKVQDSSPFMKVRESPKWWSGSDRFVPADKLEHDEEFKDALEDFIK
jgi:hypothetical protein